ncbi:thioesterase domain-containing protein, partial [Rhodococcus sp. NPDC003318]|uniref:thioesterase domain-containing protein n=1 Tax=Rhodococcus sp. NPDC003318 TaxID=3364503 RepID=UPI0036ADEC56
GPYRLVGWSLGGVIAHAMAVQLQAAGEQVEQLVMLDSVAGDAADALDDDGVTVGELLGGIGVTDAPDVDPANTSLDEVLARMAATTTGPLAGVSSSRLRQMTDSAIASAELMRQHRPGTFDGDVTLFTAAAGRGDDTIAPRSWRSAVTGQVRHVAVPVTHWSMLAPEAVAVIAPTLREGTN